MRPATSGAGATPRHDPAPDQRFGWFGKLPSAGDFVSRRMPYAVQQFWDGWCAQGMEALKAASPASGLEVWGGVPMWGFALPAQPGAPGAQVGVFAPSCDRVGRVFPFIVAAPLVVEHEGGLLGRADLLALAWADVIGRAQQARLGIDELDAGLHVALAETLAGPADEPDDPTTLPQGLAPSYTPRLDLRQAFDAHGAESFWWSVPPASTGFQTRVHSGTLRAAHMLDLCRSEESDGRSR